MVSSTQKHKNKARGLLEPISASLDVNQILQIACDTIIDFLKEEGIMVSVVLVDKEKRKKINLKAFASHQDSMAFSVDTNKISSEKTENKQFETFKLHYQDIISHSYENTVYSHCLRSNKTILEDLSLNEYKESALLLQQGISHRAIYPLISPHSDETLGTLNIGVKNLDSVKAADEAIKQICSQLALTIENSQNFYSAKKTAEQSILINKLFFEINKFEDIDSIITTTVNRLGEIMHSSRCFFAGIARDNWVVQAEYTDPQTKPILGLAGSIDLGMSIIEQALNDGYVTISDVNKEIKAESPQLYEVYKKLDVLSFIYLPIKMKGKVCGILGLSQQDYQRIWNKEDIEILEIVRDQVSVCISQTQLINDLKTSNERLVELDRLKSQLMSTVSHELRTPMANILGFSELLLHRDYNKDTSKQYLSEIHTASHRLSNLIQDFLDLSRIEATGKIPLGQFEEIEIDWIAENAWSQLASQNKDYNVEWHKSKELSAVMADPEAITRIFTNLFSNAIKYSPDNKTIKCSIEANRNDLFVCVEDQGMGIAENMVSSIFDRFFRIDNSDTRKIGGAGLGLSICKEIIEAHGGQIWCESKVNQGSKFFFTLPISSNKDSKASEAQIWLS